MRSKLMLAVVVAALAWAAAALYQQSNWKIVNNPPPAGPIVALGDSLTFGFGADKGGSYPEQLGKLIGRAVVNRGVNGDKIADAAARLDKDVLALKPSIVIILLGGNDILTQQPMDQSFKTLEGIVRRVQGRGAMVVLVGLRVIAPVGGVGARYHKLARQTGCLFVDDILDDIYGQRSLMSDQIHPNTKGYKIMAERVAGKLKPYIK
ncbi:MAG: GDSL-type esterase/lipase family protein [Candidatus Sumerlaeia bacterium]